MPTAYHIQLRETEAQRARVQELELAGVRVRLRAQYSVLADRWHVSIYDLADTLILGGITCVAGVDLLRPYRHLAIPQGVLFVVSENGEPPTFGTLDNTAKVVFRS